MSEQLIKGGKSKTELVIISLLLVIIILLVGIGYLLVSEDEVSILQLLGVFKQHEGEFNLPLEEFLVNLKSEGNKRHYIKLNVALMYSVEKEGELIESNISKIRDIILNNIRGKTYSEIIADGSLVGLKELIKEDINKVLGKEVIKEVYITDLLVQ